MRQSQLFGRTLRETPSEADLASHRLLLRAGYIRQVMGGSYTLLPLGLRVFRQVEAIVAFGANLPFAKLADEAERGAAALDVDPIDLKARSVGLGHATDIWCAPRGRQRAGGRM